VHIMKRSILVCFTIFLFASCKKTVDNIKTDLVIQAMTDGEWTLTKFTMNGVDISTDFTGYKFKYYSNKTVDAIKNGIVEKTGTWDGNASTMTTWANFTGASYPLNLINGSWHIDRNSWIYVESSQTIGTDSKTMRLDKL